MRISTAIAALLLCAVPASGADRTSTPFELLADGSIVVPVTIGRTGPYRFVLDTGSSRTVISTRLWQALRLPAVAQTVMVTPAGRDLAYVVRIDGLSMDGQPEVTVLAAAISADRYAAGQQADGLIGQDVLAGVFYTIDYEAREVVWHTAGEAPAGDRLPLSARDNRLLVSLHQRERDANPLRLVPDSGSDGLVLFAHARNKLRLTPLDVGVLSSVSGSRMVQRVQVDGMVVGGTRLKDPPAVLIDSAEPAELMGDGLLPLHLFSRVTFNLAEGYMIVQPR